MLLEMDLKVYTQTYNKDLYYDGSPGNIRQSLHAPDFLKEEFRAIPIDEVFLFLFDLKMSYKNNKVYVNIPIKKVW